MCGFDHRGAGDDRAGRYVGSAGHIHGLKSKVSVQNIPVAFCRGTLIGGGLTTTTVRHQCTQDLSIAV